MSVEGGGGECGGWRVHFSPHPMLHQGMLSNYSVHVHGWLSVHSPIYYPYVANCWCMACQAPVGTCASLWPVSAHLSVEVYQVPPFQDIGH